MRKFILFLTFTSFLFSACKKNDNKPGSTHTVTINGRAYQTVVIGKQTWTTENYDGPGGTPSSRGDESVMGKYYLLEEMKAISLPAGWRVPTQADFVALVKSQGATTDYPDGSLTSDAAAAAHLSASTTWGIPGDNKSGFNALPAGEYNAVTHEFPDLNAYAGFWTSTIGTNTVDLPTECVVVLSGYHSSPGTGSVPMEEAWIDPTRGVLNLGLSVRFVKNN